MIILISTIIINKITINKRHNKNKIHKPNDVASKPLKEKT
jgi:hypothetical protein